MKMGSETNKKKSADAEPENSELKYLGLLFLKCFVPGLIIWLIGYFGFSITWILFAVLIYVMHVRRLREKKFRRTLKEKILRAQDEGLNATDRDLRLWIACPDSEPAEWLNKILLQLWRPLKLYVANILENQIQPSLNKSLSSTLTPFRFTKTDLGDRPPKIAGVKVYTGNYVRRDEIVMDIELCYFGDADIRFKAKILTAGIKDLELRGTLRVICKPLVGDMPLIGAVSVAFLNIPEINFDLTNIGDLLDGPIFHKILRDKVNKAVADCIVVPNNFTHPLIKGISLTDLKYPFPKGVVRIHVIEAQKLIAADIGIIRSASSDPYCVLRVSSNEFKTAIIKHSLNPTWNEYFEAIIHHLPGQNLKICLFDDDQGNKDDRLGECIIKLEDVFQKGQLDSWFTLKKVKTGSLHVNLTWFDFSTSVVDFDKAALKRIKEQKDTKSLISSGLLYVIVDSALNLQPGRPGKEPDPYVVVELRNEAYDTVVREGTPNPVWEQGFTFLVTSPEIEELTVTVKDKDSGENLGLIKVPLKHLLAEPEMTTERPFQLKESSTQAILTLKLMLRALIPRPKRTSVSQVDSPNLDPSAPVTVVDGDPAASEVRKRRGVTPREAAPDKLSQEQQSLDRQSAISTESSSEASKSSPTSQTKMVAKSSESFGRIEVTVRYSMKMNSLVVVLHGAEDLQGLDSDGLCDPYVKLRLIPRDGQKKKTKVFKDTVSPVFDETFDFALNPAQLTSTTVHLEVKNHKGMFARGKRELGFVDIVLNNFDPTKASTHWFNIQSPASSQISSESEI